MKSKRKLFSIGVPHVPRPFLQRPQPRLHRADQKTDRQHPKKYKTKPNGFPNTNSAFVCFVMFPAKIIFHFIYLLKCLSLFIITNLYPKTLSNSSFSFSSQFETSGIDLAMLSQPVSCFILAYFIFCSLLYFQS